MLSSMTGCDACNTDLTIAIRYGQQQCMYSYTMINTSASIIHNVLWIDGNTYTASNNQRHLLLQEVQQMDATPL